MFGRDGERKDATTGVCVWVARCRKHRREFIRERTKEEKQTSTLRVVALSLFIPAVLAVVIYAAAVSNWNSIAVALQTATASFAAGALVGFIFGIPRTLATADSSQATADGSEHPIYGTNTNLEQISDWLTKILVGVGLVQIGQIGGAIDDLASGVEKGLGSNGHAVAVTLMVSFAITGFLCSYLYTRMRLQSALEPGREMVDKRAEEITNALALVREQLDPSGEADPNLVEITEALYKSSPGIRDEAFYLARNQRRANWRGVHPGEDRKLVALTIPVFEALVGLDKEKKFNRNRAELGFALKDQPQPDYALACSRLSEAIDLRGALLRARFPMYELNRAVCLIMLDGGFQKRAASDSETAKKIRADLDAAEATEQGREAVKPSPGNRAATAIVEWRRLNP
jgi:hypothetical protein